MEKSVGADLLMAEMNALKENVKILEESKKELESINIISNKAEKNSELSHSQIQSIIESQLVGYSNIVENCDDEKILKQWVEEALGGKVSFKLLWIGSENKFKAKSFHSCCDDKGPTVTIIQSSSLLVFGGFTSKNWKSAKGGQSVSDPLAFIYSLTQRVKCSKQKNPCSIRCNADYGPLFGYDPKGFEFKDDCVINDLGFGPSTGNGVEGWAAGNLTYVLPKSADPRTFFAGSNLFSLSEVEVFSVKKL